MMNDDIFLKFPKIVVCDHNRFKKTAVESAIQKYNLTGLDNLLDMKFSYLSPPGSM